MPDKEQSDSTTQDAQQALSPRRVERIELCGSLAGIHRVHPESPSLGLQSQIQSLQMGRDKSVTRAAAHRAEEAKWKIEERRTPRQSGGDGPARRLLACRTE